VQSAEQLPQKSSVREMCTSACLLTSVYEAPLLWGNSNVTAPHLVRIAGALQFTERPTSHPDPQRNAQEHLETVWGQSGAFNDNCEIYEKILLGFRAFEFDPVALSVLCVCLQLLLCGMQSFWKLNNIRMRSLKYMTPMV